ncbi:hypothetical protein B7494_g129, partial [Chlorociboria aeruginascens]
MSIGQALLIRNPKMTREEFSDHWFQKHARLAVPYFLSAGTSYYAQVHNPKLIDASSSTLDISAYDGAAEVVFDATKTDPKAEAQRARYYKEVILPDERRFLVSEALEHVLRVDENTVEGDKRVVIQDGKCVLEIGEDIWKVWEGFGEKSDVLIGIDT